MTSFGNVIRSFKHCRALYDKPKTRSTFQDNKRSSLTSLTLCLIATTVPCLFLFYFLLLAYKEICLKSKARFCSCKIISAVKEEFRMMACDTQEHEPAGRCLFPFHLHCTTFLRFIKGIPVQARGNLRAVIQKQSHMVSFIFFRFQKQSVTLTGVLAGPCQVGSNEPSENKPRVLMLSRSYFL